MLVELKPTAVNDLMQECSFSTGVLFEPVANPFVLATLRLKNQPTPDRFATHVLEADTGNDEVGVGCEELLVAVVAEHQTVVRIPQGKSL